MAGEHILIVEDERSVARGLKFGLEQEGFVVSWAHTGEEALNLVARNAPGLIILDVRLPGISGFDVCRQLRAAGKRQPIIMLTARDEEVDRVIGLELGADDYVVKPFGLRELISRIRAQWRRAYGELSTTPPSNQLTVGSLVIDLRQMLVTHSGRSIDLTPTEFRLLAFLAEHPERPFSRQALVEAIWGYDSEVLNARTVDVHIRHLREKLEDDPAHPRWLVTARGHGYLLRRQAEQSEP